MGFRKAGSSDIVSSRSALFCAPSEALFPDVHHCLHRWMACVRWAMSTGAGQQWPADGTAPRRAAVSADREKNWNAFRILMSLRFSSRRKARYLSRSAEKRPGASDGLRLTFSPRDFIQVNDGVNQQMVANALAWLDVQPTDRVLDLFCGMGELYPAAGPQSSKRGRGGRR